MNADGDFIYLGGHKDVPDVSPLFRGFGNIHNVLFFLFGNPLEFVGEFRREVSYLVSDLLGIFSQEVGYGPK